MSASPDHSPSALARPGKYTYSTRSSSQDAANEAQHPVGQGPPPNRTSVQSAGVIPAKSPGVAALLSLLWLGAGHLYAGSVGVGVALAILDAFLVLISLTIIGLVVTIPVYMVIIPITMLLAANSASEFNHRNGIVVR